MHQTMISALPYKILLGQLAARGDCLYATAIARQIKHDFPNSYLTWAIGSMAKDIIAGNPYVDKIWVIPLSKHSEVSMVWKEFEVDSLSRKEIGEFDKVFFTQISPNNFKNFDGTVRTSIFRSYPYPVKVPVSPVIRLNNEEVKSVFEFVKSNKIEEYENVVLFEYSSLSGQSFVNLDFALQFSKLLVNSIPKTCVILTSHQKINKYLHRNIIDASLLSFRENAELTKYCTLFIGCSSGVSWLCTSNWAKRMPMIQLLKESTSVFASMIHDYKYFNLNDELIMEITECSPEKLSSCVRDVFLRGFSQVKKKYNEKIPLSFDFYFEIIASKPYVDAYKSVLVTISRYGLSTTFLKALIKRFYLNGIKGKLYLIRQRLCKFIKLCVNRISG